ncbi:MAG: histone deacetylase family protein [Alphaproteobacteria bacterium]|nr:histone deacetylase family protein [Alphaproteobacteria bacterium]
MSKIILMKPFLYIDSEFKNHITPHGHPESPERIDTIIELLNSEEFANWPRGECAPATVEQIALAHSQDYIYELMDKAPEEGLVYLDGGDTVLSPRSFETALLAAGTVCKAVDDIFNDKNASKQTFCAVRPPGHHAEAGKAMGFCLFNNVFIAARHAQETYNIKRIAILDPDVHHGNGTENMARTHNAAHPERPIFYISTHMPDIFPGTGNPADNNATTLNIHLPYGCNSEQFRELYSNLVFPKLSEFQPDLTLISCGFDAHTSESIAPANLTSDDYGWLTRHICDIAGNTPIVSVLEGGYNLDALKKSVHAHLLALESSSPP